MRKFFGIILLLAFIAGSVFGGLGCTKKAADKAKTGDKSPAKTLKDQKQKAMDEALDESG